MKLQKLITASAIAVGFLFISSLVTSAYAVSSSNANKVKDFKLKPTNGKKLRHSDISLAIRSHYKGVRPKIFKRASSSRLNCYDVKFVYKNEIKRVSFNCTSTKLVMQAKY